jgi:threonine/homoserine efflux transporter RhtA
MTAQNKLFELEIAIQSLKISVLALGITILISVIPLALDLLGNSNFKILATLISMFILFGTGVWVVHLSSKIKTPCYKG